MMIICIVEVLFCPHYFSADSIRVINDDQNLVSIYSSVAYNGGIKWLTPVNVISSCDINISKYPFDKQSCEIIVSENNSAVNHLSLQPF